MILQDQGQKDSLSEIILSIKDGFRVFIHPVQLLLQPNHSSVSL
jgi:hypothetical protein